MLLFSTDYNYKNQDFYRIDVHDGSWDELDLSLFSQAYGIILNDQNEIVLSYNSETGNWLLPGGRPDEGEGPVETLIREVYEESAAVINSNSVKPAFYQKVFKIEGDKASYHTLQLRYIARAKEIHEFKSDPAGVITKIKWVSSDKIGEYLTWGEDSINLIKRIVEDY